MKKLSLIAVLAASTMLSACGGGGSGGGYIPTTSLTTNGAIIANSGTAVQTVNNAAERTQRYNNAVSAVNAITQNVASVRLSALPDIDTAYKNMQKILINKNYSSFTSEDILFAFALFGVDIEGLKNKTLDELKIQADNTDKTKVEDIFARFGEERLLTLDKVVFKDIDFENRGIYTFVLNKNGSVSAIKLGDEAGVEDLTLKYVAKGVYKNTVPFTNYGFYYKIPGGGSFADEVSFDHTPDAAELKEVFKKTILAEWPDSSERQAMLDWLDTADFGTIMNNEDACENAQGSCFYKDESYYATIRMDGLGEDIGLKYSDFGIVNVPEFNEHFVYSGGYEELSAKAADLPQVDTEMNFEGKAVAALTFEPADGDGDENDVLAKHTGTAKLNFKDGQETLVTDFTKSGWHKVTIETDAAKASGYAFTFEGDVSDSRFAVTPGVWKQDFVDIQYYGENPKNPDEVTGAAIYEEYRSSGQSLEAAIGFGAVRK